MVASIKMSLGMELGLVPGDFVLNGDPAPPSPKGGGAEPPNFRPMFIVVIYDMIYDMMDYTLCLKKRPTFTACYNFYIHSSIATILAQMLPRK